MGEVGLERFQNLNYLFKDLESQQGSGGGGTSPKQLERGSREELGSRQPGSSVPGQALLNLLSQAYWQVVDGEGAPSSPTLSVLSP